MRFLLGFQFRIVGSLNTVETGNSHIDAVDLDYTGVQLTGFSVGHSYHTQ